MDLLASKRAVSSGSAKREASGLAAPGSTPFSMFETLLKATTSLWQSGLALNSSRAFILFTASLMSYQGDERTASMESWESPCERSWFLSLSLKNSRTADLKIGRAH